MVYAFLNKTIWILLIIIIVRICLILLPSFHIDMITWQAWTQRLIEVTPIHFYNPNYFADYFPGYLYMLWFLGASFKFLFPAVSIFSLGFEFYLKIFTNLFDIATAYYIFKIISNYKKNLALLGAIFYLASPALIFNSSVWGQVDGILTFFLVYSAYCLLELKKSYRFSIFFALSALIKPQGIVIFPVLFTYFISNFKASKYLSLFLIPLLLTVLSLPFFLKDPVFGLFHLFQKSAGTYPYTSMFSYNLWSLAGWWIPDSTKLFGLPFQIWGFLMYLLCLIIILFPILFKRGHRDTKLLYFACALAIFSFFLFLTRMHERYLFPFFSFFLITAFITNSIRLKIVYWVLSVIHFINLSYVYYYYNFVYGNPSFASFTIYQILSQSYNLFIALNLVSFGMLLLIYYKLSYAKDS